MNKEDIKQILESDIDFSALSGNTVLITGATGLIGSNVVQTLLAVNKVLNKKIKILALIRNKDKAKRVLGEESQEMHYILGDVTEKIEVEQSIDYIIHAASQTSSQLFINQPIETMNTAIIGTSNMLELARKSKVKKFIYLSTMEVYGAPSTDEKVNEKHGTNLDTMLVRSCYPESKRLCENLCSSYMKEYNVPINVIRLTQTFGPGVEYNDGRVFAEFSRCVIENKDIVLHTKGETKRNYLYTADAVTAIFTVMLKGKDGEAYNAANESTYCSIYDMAVMVADKCANSKIDVKVEIEDETKFGFAPVLKMNLDTSKLQALLWKPKTGLQEMFNKLICDMKLKK